MRALTPVHAGVGRGGELVDLPVQRDEFGFPCIWASSLKGALRAAIRLVAGNEHGCINAVFGAEPGTSEVSEYSSAVNLLDARLLFIPVRSLRGVWVYVTSPHLLGYLATYLEALGRQVPNELRDSSRFVGVASRDVRVNGSRAILNEEEVSIRSIDEHLVDAIFGSVLPRDILQRVKGRGLVVVEDDVVAGLVRRSMLVQYRVRLKYETKTVDTGPWSEEYLPEETILVSGVICRSLSESVRERTKCTVEPCSWIEQKMEKLNYSLWLGGKTTIGRGFLKLYFV